MSNPLKKLAGQTAVYGMGTIVPRLLNYILVPYYTGVFSTARYGVITDLYAYVAFFLAVLTFGMETAFFRYASLKSDKVKVFSTVFISVFTLATFFLILISSSYVSLAELMSYAGNPEFILFVAIIVSMDAVSSIPSAMLRELNKAKKFSIIKLTSVGVNISINLILISGIPLLLEYFPNETLAPFFTKDQLLRYVLIANLFSSGVQLLMLRKEIAMVKWNFDWSLFRELLKYALPIAVIGIAGMLNEVSDRILFKYLFVSDDVMSDLGIYGANYKLAVFMTLFIQMFRYAAEPFFFSMAKEKNAKSTYAAVMKYFVWFAFAIFLMITLFIDGFKYFINEEYWDGLKIVPIILLANLFLGIFYNLSVWYKLNNLTRYGAYIAITGSLITLFINFTFVPQFGYIASAWGHFACTSIMILISYFLGRKIYRIDYDLKSIFIFAGSAIILFTIGQYLQFEQLWMRIASGIVLFSIYLMFFYFKEKKLVHSIIYRK